MSEQTGATGTMQVMERLQGWLCRWADADEVSVSEVSEPAQGFSSRTILFTASWAGSAGVQRRELVVRIQREIDCPLLSDIFRQYRVMEVAGAARGVPVPALLAAEADPSLLGSPFYLMERVHGRVPPDFPTMHAEGWVYDLPSQERTKTWWNGIAAMERLHRIDWRAFPFLGTPAEAPDARFYLKEFIGRWFDWASEGKSFPVIENAIDRLNQTAPPVTRAGVVWNDARMGNVMFRPDGEVASLFDFEVATLGPPEIDLAWWLYAEDIFSIQFGVERLPDIPEGPAAIAGFERLYGQEMPDFDYYLAIAALKHAVISIRDYSNGKVIDTPDALPGFAIDRMHQAMERYARRHG